MGPDNFVESCPDLNRRILEAVLGDFEPFESIVHSLSAQNLDNASDEVRRLLLVLLADELVGAYLIHADPPYITPVEPTPDTIERYWFMITEKGLRYLQPQPEQQVRALQTEIS